MSHRVQTEWSSTTRLTNKYATSPRIIWKNSARDWKMQILFQSQPMIYKMRKKNYRGMWGHICSNQIIFKEQKRTQNRTGPSQDKLCRIISLETRTTPILIRLKYQLTNQKHLHLTLLLLVFLKEFLPSWPMLTSFCGNYKLWSLTQKR